MVQDLIDDERPLLINHDAEAVYEAFHSLIEFAGGMDPIPIIRYEAVTCWLDENEIHNSVERREVRYLLRSLLHVQRRFREEHKPKKDA